MLLLGVIVNGAAVAGGGIIGTLLQKGFSDKIRTTLMQGLALCVIYVGYSGSLEGQNVIITIISIIIGGMIGTWLDYDKRINNFGNRIQQLVSQRSQSTLAEGFTNAALFVCTGAMAIVGSMQSGLTGSHDILFAKAVIDAVFAFIMASTMGIGVSLAGGAVLIYEAILTFSASGISAYLTTEVIAEISCVGSLLILAMGLNLLKVTDIKIANFLLAPFVPILLLGILPI